MADINQVITLGIGTPAGVQEFLTFGLQIGSAVELTAGLEHSLPEMRLHYELPKE